MRPSRVLILGAALIALAACGNDSSKPKVGATALQRVMDRVKGGRDAPQPTPTADQLRAAVTPEFRAQTGNAPLLLASSTRLPVSSIMVMAGENAGVRTYFAPDGISFSLRQGVLIASRGLGTDLMRADVSQVLPRVQAGEGFAVRVHHYLDGENQTVERRFTCSYTTQGAEVVESCSGGETSFENRYFLNDNGEIAVSIQWVSPQLQSYRLEDLG
jgi:hypothetical protein